MVICERMKLQQREWWVIQCHHFVDSRYGLQCPRVHKERGTLGKLFYRSKRRAVLCPRPFCVWHEDACRCLVWCTRLATVIVLHICMKVLCRQVQQTALVLHVQLQKCWERAVAGGLGDVQRERAAN